MYDIDADTVSECGVADVGVTKEKHGEDAVKAANITLTEEETALLEQTADALNINAIRFWEKEMK